MTRKEKIKLIEELHDDSEFMAGVKRGLEARRKGDRIHWNDVKAELGIQ